LQTCSTKFKGFLIFVGMNIHEILETHWGYTSFRPLQEDIIRSVMAGHDTLALLPTGGGKSLCFQVPALALGGLCVVVSPLIALMQDQVMQLQKRGIKAVAIHSGMHPKAVDIALDNCVYGDTQLLYLSPERLQNELLLARVAKMNVTLLAIDEAHCISQWGFDFRPSYLQIIEFRKKISPQVPVLALTATATAQTQTDIVEQLQMKSPQVFQQSFVRANLSYSALLTENIWGQAVQILQKIPGTSVVYVRNRRRTQELAQWFSQHGIAATFYHAGLPAAERQKRQNQWTQNQVRVMVATNAFGMGIDKPDVRVVLHLGLPDTLEAYYQEAGRAGRDGQKSFAVALYGPADVEQLLQRVAEQFPSAETIRKVYHALGNYYQLAVGAGQFTTYDFDLQDFTHRFGAGQKENFFALKKLEEQGFLQLSEGYHSPSKLQILIDNRTLYDFQLRNESLAGFIRFLLRMYGGELFTQPKNIVESQIAQHFSIPEAEVVRLLIQLNKLGVWAYEPSKDKPQLTFLIHRHEASKLPLDVPAMQYREQLMRSKAEAVAKYVTQNQRCRTHLLLAYFGENTETPCGICDYCVQQKRQAQQQDQQQILVEAIFRFLEDGAMGGEALTRLLAPYPAKQVMDTLRLLLDAQKVVQNTEGLYERPR
jgi:ATP-dependent DNA helicase RecQ